MKFYDLAARLWAKKVLREAGFRIGNLRRKDIPEGAYESQMPKFGYGRIRTYTDIEEWYATSTARGRRVFYACGRYDGKDRSVRGWLRDRSGVHRL